ncbi:MAG: Ku protein [Planctomycetota bacterium]
MPRPIWKGQISFGLVNVPVVLYSADQARELHFNLIDRRNNARVRYERVNETTGEPVPWDEIVKGYAWSADRLVLLSDEDFKRAAVEASRTVEIQDFVDAREVDLRYFEKPYYLAPDKRGEKGYVLLREALQRAGKLGIATVVIHSRQHLAALQALGPGLVLMLLRFHDELRPLEEFELPKGGLEDYRISPKELDLAGQLIESMAGTWEPQKYRDEYRESLLRWIEEKAERGDLAPAAAGATPEAAPAGEVVNIMDLLRASVEQRAKREKAAGAPRAKTAKRKRA